MPHIMEAATPATPPVPVKRRKREETRRRLLKSAFGVFARNGYDRATVDEIVRDAGFSKGAFYVHFNSKEDLFWAMLEDRATSLQEAVLAVVSPDATLRGNIRSLLVAIFDIEEQDPEWPATFTEFLAHAGRNPEVRDRLAAIFDDWHRFIAEMLKFSREAGQVREDLEIDLLARASIALIHGTMIQNRLAPSPEPIDKVVGTLCELLAEMLEGR